MFWATKTRMDQRVIIKPPKKQNGWSEFNTHIQTFLLHKKTLQSPSEVYLRPAVSKPPVWLWNPGEKGRGRNPSRSLPVMRGQRGLKLLITNTYCCKGTAPTAARAGRGPGMAAACGKGLGRNKWVPRIDVTSRVSADTRFSFNTYLCNFTPKVQAGLEFRPLTNSSLKIIRLQLAGKIKKTGRI